MRRYFLTFSLLLAAFSANAKESATTTEQVGGTTVVTISGNTAYQPVQTHANPGSTLPMTKVEPRADFKNWPTLVDKDLYKPNTAFKAPIMPTGN